MKRPNILEKKLFISVAGLALLSGSLVGCNGFPYRIDIEQGNVIDQQQLSQLQIGMSKEQVKYYLGSSLLTDMFHKNRWDYVQYYKSGRTKELQKGLVSLFFTNNYLSNIQAEHITEIKKEPLRYGSTVDRELDKEEVLIEDVLHPSDAKSQ